MPLPSDTEKAGEVDRPRALAPLDRPLAQAGAGYGAISGAVNRAAGGDRRSGNDRRGPVLRSRRRVTAAEIEAVCLGAVAEELRAQIVSGRTDTLALVRAMMDSYRIVTGG